METKGKGLEKIFYVNGEKKPGILIFIYNKIDFKTKDIISDKKRTLCNVKENNPTKGYNPSKYLCTQHSST